MSEGRNGPGRASPGGSPPALAGGFSGTVGSLPLVDVLQVEALNRFSGLVGVRAGDQGGLIYFVEGEIVHAEAAGRVGEEAMCVMVAWADGSFELAPNTATLERTIEKTFNHLMLDCHRVLDETRRTPAAPAQRPSRPPPRPPPLPPAPADPGARLLARVGAIPGVSRVVQTGRDGRPVGDESPEAEALAARGLYVSFTHAPLLGETFGLGTFTWATVAGEDAFLVRQSSGGGHLVVAVEPGAPVAGVEAQVRQALGRQGDR